ncbi:sarcosine oxidase subunit gamma family protein [Rhodovibrio sodomensis]|uniref:sarcosine oxidase subunit gamma family protein n=1 Tax=Rhodovibrio sodomensis TaxID=1088 RepID=UPI0019061DB1
MADLTLAPVSPLARALTPGDVGAVGPGGPGVVFRDRRDLSLVTIQVRPDKQAAARQALEGAGFALPPVGQAARSGEVSVIWSALDRWIAIAPWAPGELHRTLADPFGGDPRARGVALVDQSSGLFALQVGGPKLDALLAKGTPVDLHALETDRTAATGIDHQPVTLWRIAPQTVLLLVGRAFAQDTLEFLQEMALEYGYRNG